jgi:hypothetical protein
MILRVSRERSRARVEFQVSRAHRGRGDLHFLRSASADLSFVQAQTPLPSQAELTGTPDGLKLATGLPE